MTELRTSEALELYRGKVTKISIEKDYGDFGDEDIAIYVNLYDKDYNCLNSREVYRSEDEEIANNRVKDYVKEYKSLGYNVVTD